MVSVCNRRNKNGSENTNSDNRSLETRRHSLSFVDVILGGISSGVGVSVPEAPLEWGGSIWSAIPNNSKAIVVFPLERNK